MLIALANRYAFGDVAALATRSASVQRLCEFGQRLLDLDAEDFDKGAVPEDLRQRAMACRMPQYPNERHRGALGTLRPVYRLLLEVIDARWRRREMAALVAVIHITSEYAPLLVWEQVLGHAGDPAQLPTTVGGQGSAWGDFDDRECRHSRAEKSAAKAVLRVARDSPTGWRSYLDRQHSNMAHALGVCAVECERPCRVITSLSKEDEQRVADGCRLALAYVDSPIVRLRHSAPVGHGFGVPAPEEVLDAWSRSRRSLARHDPAAVDDDGFVLPGLARFFSTLAGAQLSPETLLRDTAAALTNELTP